jgi:two-component system nitrogen regulation sensor histidine kinase NtrY
VQVQRGLREADMVDGTGTLRTRGNRSYLFDFERPTDGEIKNARDSGGLVIEDWTNNEFRALVPLASYVDRFLYVSREVDGEILSLLDETQETVRLYQQLESERGRVLFEFGLLYLGFAVILILAAIWLGLWFAERLSGPVGRLTGAAQRVGSGDLDVQVPEEEGDDEIAMLGRYFNQMTKQLKAQRKTLLDNTKQIERRGRLFDSVLGSVTSGVVGVDAKGKVSFVNRSGVRLLDWQEDRESVPLAVAVPEFAALFALLRASPLEVAQDEVKVTRGGRLENLLVRMAKRRRDDGRLEGYVVAFDDVTDLVSAQRMAAWGDVARRIAHEIKNPLTPIQLSAERIKRKFAPKLGEDSDSLEQMTDVIVRQTGDLRRIVDEFSKFARMPEPDRKRHDLVAIVRDAVVLQRAGQPEVQIAADLPRDELLVEVDATMISQALTNLIKNAGEAIETLYKKGMAPDGHQRRVEVAVTTGPAGARITIADNGIGLPADRARLFEPYVTTRDEGTGLGLPIVKKIIEEHGGTLTLDDAAPFAGHTHSGAMAVVTLPIEAPLKIEQEQAT